jgi:photosystem II stability/assembly factor-like uncharacterized protein
MMSLRGIAAGLLIALLTTGCSVGAASGGMNGATPTRSPTGSRSPATPSTAAPTPPAKSIHFKHVWMLTATRGFAVSVRGRMLWTSDGGRTWRDGTPAGIRAVVRSGVTFEPGPYPCAGCPADAYPGWAVVAKRPSGTRLLFTPNGGQTWHERSLPAGAQDSSILGLSFVTPNDGWLLTSGGAAAGSMAAVLYRTTNGGFRWSEVAQTHVTPRPSAGPGQIPFGGDKTGLAFANPERGWVSGVTAALGHVYLLATPDGGRDWSFVTLKLPESFPNAQFASEPPVFFPHGHGILAVRVLGRVPPSEALFFSTGDGGVSWSAVKPVVDRDPSSYGFVWIFADPAHGWAADGAHLYATSDGGRTWQAVATNRPLRQVSQLDFVNATVGWAVDGERLLATTDGGKTWTTLAEASP